MKDRDDTPTQDAQMRDAFAAHALTGMGTWMPSHIASGEPNGLIPSLCNPDMLAARAEWAYAQADAMMAQRNK